MNNRQAPILAQTTIAAHRHGENVSTVFKAEGGLHYIAGNKAPYFSLTYWRHRKGFPNQCQSGGAGHDLILKLFPRFADLAALHLSSIEGEPGAAEDNGLYWIAGALGGLGERYHGAYNDSHTADECKAIALRHFRCTAAELDSLLQAISESTDRAARLCLISEFCNEMRPRWKREAEACIAKHRLVVFGDEWPKNNV